jgi:PTH1 family peptidyl-tRNA hydrolase
VTKLVVGLGNPGPEHEWTPHNLGFHAVEHLARSRKAIFGPPTRLPGFHGPPACAVAHLPEADALLAKPLTWMNRSGTVVASLLAWCGGRAEDLFVVFDDIDLEPGVLRIRPHGGTGGHRGVESIVSELGTDRFPRLRIGVGRPRTDAARHVLDPLSGPEREEAEISVAQASEALSWWLEVGDLERCMTRFHSRWQEDRPSAGG